MIGVAYDRWQIRFNVLSIDYHRLQICGWEPLFAFPDGLSPPVNTENQRVTFIDFRFTRSVHWTCGEMSSTVRTSSLNSLIDVTCRSQWKVVLNCAIFGTSLVFCMETVTLQLWKSESDFGEGGCLNRFDGWKTVYMFDRGTWEVFSKLTLTRIPTNLNIAIIGRKESNAWEIAWLYPIRFNLHLTVLIMFSIGHCMSCMIPRVTIDPVVAESTSFSRGRCYWALASLLLQNRLSNRELAWRLSSVR